MAQVSNIKLHRRRRSRHPDLFLTLFLTYLDKKIMLIHQPLSLITLEGKIQCLSQGKIKFFYSEDVFFITNFLFLILSINVISKILENMK